MKYMGSKRRIAKDIKPIMTLHRKKSQAWVEPFVGGGNMISEIYGRRIGSDAHKPTIQALRLIQNNPELIPRNNSEFTEADYKALRKQPDHYLHGFAMVAYSFGGDYVAGFARDNTLRDYINEAWNNAMYQHYSLQGVALHALPYDRLAIPRDSIIYCDPPYEGVKGYATKFNHDDFWQWVRDKSKLHQVFVSEYNAPSDFVELWSKDITTHLDNQLDNSFTATERLFTYGSGIVNIESIFKHFPVQLRLFA